MQQEALRLSMQKGSSLRAACKTGTSPLQPPTYFSQHPASNKGNTAGQGVHVTIRRTSQLKCAYFACHPNTPELDAHEE
eukprot:1141979-Pelagomonas_calceolata.AAC.1